MAQGPRFTAEAKRVTVDIVVTDKEGRPVAGLTRGDFVVRENGANQEIIEFEAVDVDVARSTPVADRPRIATNSAPETPGRSFLVALDDLNLTPSSAHNVRRALAAFLDTQLAEGDWVTLAPASGAAWWSGRMTRDRDQLQAAVKALQWRRIPDTRPERMSDYEAMRIETDRDAETIAHVTQRHGLYGLLGPVVDDPDRPPLASATVRDGVAERPVSRLIGPNPDPTERAPAAPSASWS